MVIMTVEIWGSYLFSNILDLGANRRRRRRTKKKA